MLGCGEGKYSVYCRGTNKEDGQLVFKRLIFPNGFQCNIRGEGPRVCDQLLDILLIG